MTTHRSDSAFRRVERKAYGTAIALGGESVALDHATFGRHIMDLVHRVRRAHLRSKTILALSSLDERTLKDIGVNPHDIPWIAECLVRADNDNWRKPDNDNAQTESALGP